MTSRTEAISLLLVLARSALCWSAPAGAIDTVVALEVPRPPIVGPPPVIQRFIMLDLADIPSAVPDPLHARGVLVLFAGGAGRLGIGDSRLSILQTNFLVRTRHQFAAQGFHVAVMDAATDFLMRPEGLGSSFRLFEGGFAPLDEPCEALTAHGFFGIESQVVEAIGRFILRQ